MAYRRYRITVNLRIQVRSQTQNPGLEYTPRAHRLRYKRRRGFYSWFYDELNTFPVTQFLSASRLKL